MIFGQDAMPIPPRESLSGTLAAPRGYVAVSGKYVPVFPLSDASVANKIINSLGSFWSAHFAGRGELTALYSGEASCTVQSYIDYLESVACTSRFECPVFKQRTWYALTIKESELDTGRAALLQYGDDDAVYDGAYSYGVPLNNNFYELDLDNIKHISLLTNRILTPSVTWINGSDFCIEDGALILRNDPFSDNRFASRNVTDSRGDVIDREIVLWAFDTAEDQNFLYQHYGYVLRHKMASSQGYKDLINAAWNGYTGGLAVKDMEWLIAAIAGLDVVKETEEVVEQILYQDTKTVVVTDYHGYIYPAGSISRLDIGDHVYAGQSLVDTVMVFDMASFDDQTSLLTSRFISDAGQLSLLTDATLSSSSGGAAALTGYVGHRQASKLLPDAEYAPLLVALPVGRGLLPDSYEGALSFVNERGEFDTSTADANGRVIGKIATVNGSEDDLDKLWSEAHTAGVAAGTTWLELLKPVPAYVNPAGFAIEHFLSNHCVVVYLRHTRFDTDAQGIGLLRLLRDTLPPEKTVIFLIDIDAGSDEVAPDSSDYRPGVEYDSPQIAGSDTDPQVFVVSNCE